ncbi:MAG TPA: thioredoxin domain-containing protein [Thermoanaerobaculia bacterium]|nr:thioredoxin domain-containing protein [Thermoanaerobaculia bacterium]
MRSRSRAVLPLLLLSLLAGLPAPTAAQKTADPTLQQLHREVQALRRGQEQIRQQLTAIQALLAEQEAGAEAERPVRATHVDVAGAPSRGREDAPLVLVEFADYQCRFCARYARETLPLLLERYVEPGQVRYVFMDFPLASHPHAEMAARAAHCAGEQAAFWAMHDLLLASVADIGSKPFVAFAAQLGIDLAPFAQCLESGRHAATVQRRRAAGEAAGVTATPFFLIGYPEPGSSRVRVDSVLRGAVPTARFQQELDDLLLEIRPATPPPPAEQ